MWLDLKQDCKLVGRKYLWLCWYKSASFQAMLTFNGGHGCKSLRLYCPGNIPKKLYRISALDVFVVVKYQVQTLAVCSSGQLLRLAQLGMAEGGNIRPHALSRPSRMLLACLGTHAGYFLSVDWINKNMLLPRFLTRQISIRLSFAKHRVWRKMLMMSAYTVSICRSKHSLDKAFRTCWTHNNSLLVLNLK